MNKESGNDASLGPIAGPSGHITSDVETYSSSDNTFAVSAARSENTVPAVQKKKRKRVFCLVWLEDPAFKSWLQQNPSNPYTGRCSICCMNILAMKSNLLRHGSSQEHIKNMRYQKRSVETSTDPSTSTDETSTMDVRTESSSDNTFTVPAAKKRQSQTFMPDWLEDPAFKQWLQQVQGNPYQGKCTYCNIIIKAKRSNLQQHADTKKHMDNVKYGKRVVPGEGTRTFTDEVKEAEIRVCTDAIEHNRPFNSYNHYVKLSQKVFANPNVLKRMSLSGRKMKAISLNVINKSIVEKTIQKIQGKYFSVMIDETTDVSNMKLLCILIRYVDKEEICTDLLDLIRINEATAENLYHHFKQSLDKFNLLISNMVGVCVDNANVMVGAHNSVTSRILAANDEIYVQPCICHALHLAARHACDCLPKDIEKFLQSLYSYFSQSPKRLCMLEGTQEFMKVSKRKLKQPSTTRWLALAECIKRVLEQWTVLFVVIAEAAADNESVAEKLLSSMNSPFTKAYLEFIDYYLTGFTIANKLFQSSGVLVHRLLPECNRLVASLVPNFIKYDKIGTSDMHKIDIYNVENLKPLTTIYTGEKCMNTLQELTIDNWEENEDMVQFFTNVRKCYQTGHQNIVNRVPFDNTFLKALNFLNPETAAYITNHKDDQVQCVLNKFRSKFEYGVLDEWIRLPSAYLTTSEEEIKKMSLPQFWHKTSTIFLTDQPLCGNISKLAQLCLSLPHSNADIERYFSIVTQIKNKCRNRLQPETLAALTRIKLDMSNQNACCFNYTITDDMIQLFNNSMYDNNTEIPEDLLGNVLADE